MRLIQISDTHIGPAADSDYLGVPVRDSLNQVLALARRRHWPAGGLLLTGDLTYDGEPEAYEWLAERLRTVDVPVACLPGNHDQPARLHAALGGAGVQTAGGYDLGQWRVELLDSTDAPHHHGRLTAQQLADLRTRLAAASDRHVIVALHHHPVPMGSPWLDRLDVQNHAEFWEVAAQAPNLRAVIFGHVHQEHDGEREGVRVLGCPSTCMQFSPNQQEFTLDTRAPGYRWLDLNDDGSLQTGVERLAALPLM